MKSPIEYIKLSIRTYTRKENFIFYAKVMAILTIVSTSLSLLMGYIYPVDIFESLDYSNIVYTGGFIILSLLTVLFGVYIRSTTLALVTSTDNWVRGIFAKGLKKYLTYFLASTAVGLLIMLGLILLIIPGIILGIWFSFTLFLIFDKGVGVRYALKESRSMVKGKFWKILWRFVVFGLFMILVSMIIGYIPYVGSVLNIFIAPIFLLPSYFMYKDLKIV